MGLGKSGPGDFVTKGLQASAGSPSLRGGAGCVRHCEERQRRGNLANVGNGELRVTNVECEARTGAVILERSEGSHGSEPEILRLEW